MKADDRSGSLTIRQSPVQPTSTAGSKYWPPTIHSTNSIDSNQLMVVPVTNPLDLIDDDADSV